MACYYQYDEYGNETAVEYEGNRLPSPGYYKLGKDGKWWKQQTVPKSSDYINVGDGVVSPIDDKFYSCGRAYADHAKRNDLVLVGSDYGSLRKKRLDKIAEKQASKRLQIS